MKNKAEELWVLNISKKAVNLSDLGLVLQPNQKINLLRVKNINRDKIEQSLKSGSLQKKRNFLSLTSQKISLEPSKKLLENKIPWSRPDRSLVRPETKTFEEFDDENKGGDGFLFDD